MNALLLWLVGSGSSKATTDRISISDIESQIRAIGSGAEEALGKSKATALGAIGLSAVGLVVTFYLLGRRRGRKRSTVLEIRRI